MLLGIFLGDLDAEGDDFIDDNEKSFVLLPV